MDRHSSYKGRLSNIVREFRTVARSCEDFVTVLSHQVYAADLACCENVKAAAKHRTLGAEAISGDLWRLFQKNAAGSAAAAAKPVAAGS